MIGAEHYQEAERLLGLPGQQTETGGPDNPAQLAVMAEAQVHATLALAAATALRSGEGALPSADCKAWHHAAADRSDRKPLEG